jgi:flagellar hook-associated protein 2
MSRITSSIGLITGIPIEDTVNQLMSISARPRNNLQKRNEELVTQQVAIDQLSSQVLSLQFSANSLKADRIYNARTATSSDTQSLTAKIPTGKTPPVGSLKVRPVRTASAQQLVSNRFDSLADFTGSGSFSFRVGGFVNEGRSLDALNSGTGIQRGKIKITDRNGNASVIDLTFAQNVDDVLRSINADSTISVTASTSGDRFVLQDNSGGSGNLVVEEVNGGNTAADLGLGGISVAASTATGGDVFTLHRGTKLAALNDGNGVYRSAAGVADLDITLADGTNAGIDLAGSKTLGDVIDAIENNTALTGKITAAIAADGNRLELTDTSGGGGNFTVAAGPAGTAAADLGIATTAPGATLTGGRLGSGLRDTLVTSLNGGRGFGALGAISIFDRTGDDATIDLSSAETLADVVDLINASGVQVTAAINQARSGIVITDTSGGPGNLVVASDDATNSAEALGIAVDDAVASVNSGTLNRQTLSESTLLASLNAGKGVILGNLTVTDSAGNKNTANLTAVGNQAKTVGDVIEAINGLGLGVEARINDTGDGLLIVDTAEGGGPISVRDLGASNVAQGLNLTRASGTVDLAGVPTVVIDGTFTQSIDLADLGGLESESALLSSFNNGNGVAAGDLVITDSEGDAIAIDLDGTDSGITSVGQLIDAINAKALQFNVGVVARVNDAGNGIYLEDTAGGTGTLTVRDVGSTTAADLGILGEARTVAGVQSISGKAAFTTVSGVESGLATLAERINLLDAGVTATTLFDGVGYRLSISVQATGAANQLLLDAGDSGISFSELSRAEDALLAYGDVGAPGGGLLVRSATNEFKQVIGGLDLTIAAASDKAVTIDVRSNTNALVDEVQDLVDAYNAVRENLGELTAFDAENATTGILFGTGAALQVDSRLSRVFSDRYFGVGGFQSLEQLGLSLDPEGMLQLDRDRLVDAISTDSASVKEFFTNESIGFVAKLNDVVDRLAGSESSQLSSRSISLQSTIEVNEQRLETLDLRLERERERLLLQFAQLETLIAKLQDNQSALSNFQAVPPLSFRNK